MAQSIDLPFGVIDSGAPKEAQVQSYSPGGANVHSWGHIGATWRIRL